jgi:cysteinyl-tRNA synthetase
MPERKERQENRWWHELAVTGPCVDEEVATEAIEELMEAAEKLGLRVEMCSSHLDPEYEGVWVELEQAETESESLRRALEGFDALRDAAQKLVDSWHYPRPQADYSRVADEFEEALAALSQTSPEPEEG